MYTYLHTYIYCSTRGVKEALRKDYKVTSTGLKSLQTAWWPWLSRSADFHYSVHEERTSCRVIEIPVIKQQSKLSDYLRIL